MPQFDGTQMRIGGEILSSSILNSTTATTLTLTDSYQEFDDNLFCTFTSDRSGNVEVCIQFYLEKTTSDDVGEVSVRLINGTGAVVAVHPNTTKKCALFHSSDGNQMVTFSWIMGVTDGTSYTFNPQIERSSSTNTFNVVHGGDRAPLIMKVIGL